MKKTILLLLLLCLYSFSEQIVYGYAAYYEPDPTLEQIDAIDYLSFGCFPPVNNEGDIQNPWGKKRLHTIISHAQSVGTKTILSFGGGNITLSAELVENDARRQRMVSNCMDIMEEFSFDGFDNDWEPDFTATSTDSMLLKNNRAMRDYYGIFMKEVRDSMDARFGEGTKTLTAAIMKEPEHTYWNLGYKEVCYPDSFWIYCDYLMVMNWGKHPGRDYANVDDCFEYMTNWQEFGIPDEKLVPGIGFWGTATWTDMCNYNTLIELHGSNDSSITYVTYDFGAGSMDYGFSNIGNVTKKTARAKELGFGGVGVNSLGGDVPIDHPMSLLRAITKYEIQNQCVEQNNTIDTLQYSHDFEDTIVLSNHFNTSKGSLAYRIVGELQRHKATIVDDTLFLTSDGIEQNSCQNFTIRASRVGVPTDFVDQELFLIVDERTSVEAVESSNLIQSSPWAIFKSDDELLFPVHDEDLRTTQQNDTVINIQSNIPTSYSTWSWKMVRPTVFDDTTFDFTNSQLIVEYQSSMIESNWNLAINFYDTSGAYHIVPLSVNPGEWICDTITAEDLQKAYLQPETIDYSQIDTVCFNIGGNRGGAYSFSARTFRFEDKSTAIATPIYGKTEICRIQSVNKGVLNLNHNFSSDHQLKMYDIRGRELFRKAITAGTGTTSIALPMARGIYVAQISGAEFNRSWKLQMQ